MRTILKSAAALLVAASGIPAQQACEKLMSTPFSGVTIVSATHVSAGPLELPTKQSPAVPEMCRVVARAETEINFELWMPVQWNHKLVAVGNGGLAGTINYAQMIKPVNLEYATSSTDTGHAGANTNDGAWALNHYERIVDFADRAIHVMAQADKQILNAYYGNTLAHSYFNGCSQGGHEALIEAQRYPADFDGIVAGDPANNWTRHYVGGHLWVAMATDGDAYIPAAKVPVLANAVNTACDALDGIKDGVLNDPRRCRFDPATIECKGADEPTCLTSAQVGAVKKLWSGLHDANGDQIYPGLLPGGEAGPGGWANWITGRGPGMGGHERLGIPFFQDMVFDNPAWDWHTFRIEETKGEDSDIDFTDAKLAALFNATDPDLTKFEARGGKLIQYHGWSDPDITPLNSVNYYQSVVAFNAHGGLHGLRDTKTFYRLFMVPGMQHCSGGPGPSTFDMLGPLDEWVEKGVAPERVVASHVVNGVRERTRPLCPYPQEAVWKGTGSTDDAANFTCVIAP
ncbi:MAG: tannase/feruloyl esterase family alpha/beta hydrolase [Acidobacteriota bacterium]|nr:tannase/feruloyl esterase family alpha/beta hydrolase [Acidobacteriota bacterium]